MPALSTLIRPAVGIPETIRNACPSSWISWVIYWSAISVLNDTGFARELLSGGQITVVLAAGLVAFFAASLAIQRHMQLSLQANTFGAPQRLVTGGIFQVSRNPIYAAFLLPLASLAIVSPFVSVAAIAVYILAMNRFVIRREERMLSQSFGADYAAYCRTVPRWLV